MIIMSNGKMQGSCLTPVTTREATRPSAFDLAPHETEISIIIVTVTDTYVNSHSHV